MSNKQTKKTISTKKTTKKATGSKSTAASTRAAAKEAPPTGTPAETGPSNPGRASAAALAARMPAVGTVIQKKDRYGKVRCACTIEEGGIRYARKLYRSLSAAAMAAAQDLELTNKTQNGWTFWGLTKPARPPSDAVEVVQRGWARHHGNVEQVVKAGVTPENRATVLATLQTQANALLALRDEVA